MKSIATCKRKSACCCEKCVLLSCERDAPPLAWRRKKHEERDETFQLFPTQTSHLRRQDGAKRFDCGVFQSVEISSSRKVKYRWLFITGAECPRRLRGVAIIKSNLDHGLTRVYELNDRRIIFGGMESRGERPRDLESAPFEPEHDFPLHMGCHTPSDRQNLPPPDHTQNRASNQDHHRPRVHCSRSGTGMGSGS